jgi:haloalkane dehalogenase
MCCTDEQQAGFAAPFPVETAKQGARRFPSLIPLFPDDVEVPANRQAWEVLRQFEKPFLTAFSEEDPGKMDQQFQAEVPGAAGQKHVRFKNAMHYTQDDVAEEFAEVVLAFIADNP